MAFSARKGHVFKIPCEGDRKSAVFAFHLCGGIVAEFVDALAAGDIFQFFIEQSVFVEVVHHHFFVSPSFILITETDASAPGIFSARRFSSVVCPLVRTETQLVTRFLKFFLT